MMNMNPLSIEEINARAALSEIQYREGNVHYHSDVMQALRQRSIQTA